MCPIRPRGLLTIFRQTDRDVEAIHLDRQNTVKSLRDQLQKLVDEGLEGLDTTAIIKNIDPEAQGLPTKP